MDDQEFRFLDGIATADAAFEAYGKTLEQLYSSAARAMFAAMVDISRLRPEVSREVRVEAEHREELLYNWLSELVYLKDVYGELYCVFDVQISRAITWRLRSTVFGLPIAKVREHTHTDVKAVTYHHLSITESAEGFVARVILDL